MKKKLFVFCLLLIALLSVCSIAAAATCYWCGEDALDVTFSYAYSCRYTCSACGESGGKSHLPHSGPCVVCGEVVPCDPIYTHDPDADGVHIVSCRHVVDGIYPDSCTLKPASEACFGGNGSCMPFCEGCITPRYDPDGTHNNMVKWYFYSSTQHKSYCADCRREDSYQYADHNGGDDSCMPVCADCGGEYYNPAGTHYNMTEWYLVSATQHMRYCGDCNRENSVQYGEHSGGDGSCMPVCEVCGGEYYNPAGTHDMTEWEPVSATLHMRYCADCGTDAVQYGEHSGGDGSCQPICEVCGGEYYNPAGTHTGMTEWFAISPTQHMRYCKDCGGADAVQYVEHSGGDGSCMPICEACGTQYKDLNGTHNMAEWYFFSSSEHRRYCLDCNDVSTYESEEHIYDDSCMPICAGCGAQYYNPNGKHAGGTATCTEQAKCAFCSQLYGALLGHDYAAARVEPTCTEGGYTQYTCKRCGSSYTAKPTDPLIHWYNLWNSNGDDTHSALCRRENCGYQKTVGCEWYETTVKHGETETSIKVCPVCGEYGAGAFAVLTATIREAEKDALPLYGEPIVRGWEAPCEGVQYAFTAAYEFAGKVMPFRGVVTVTLPVTAENFRLVRAEGDVWTEIAFTLEEGSLTFETDVPGLFLLVPAE